MRNEERGVLEGVAAMRAERDALLLRVKALEQELEKARADNAALREALQKFRDSISFGKDWGAWFCSPAPYAPKAHPNAVGANVLRDSSVEESGLPLRFDAGDSPEPSTAAEFVAVRKSLIAAWGEENEDDHAFVAISLLERRMGAMARAIQRALDEDRCSDATDEELSAALADAPPLFSLGEIDAACAAIGSHLGSEVEKLVLLEFRQRLLALQK